MPKEQSFAAFTENLEIEQMRQLGDRLVTKSLLYHLAYGEQSLGVGFGDGEQLLLMGEDPRLPEMPEEPTLIDFFKLRFAPAQQHLLQSANLAQKNGLSEIKSKRLRLKGLAI